MISTFRIKRYYPFSHVLRFRHAHYIAFRGHSGITVISGTNIVMACVELWSIYDPADPQKYLYDVDNGETDA